jgi:hypothetical protein
MKRVSTLPDNASKRPSGKWTGAKNVLAYMRYLRLQKEDVPQILQVAAERCYEWFDLAGDAIHASRLPEGSSAMLVSLDELRPLTGAGAEETRVVCTSPSTAPGSCSPDLDPPPTDSTPEEARQGNIPPPPGTPLATVGEGGVPPPDESVGRVQPPLERVDGPRDGHRRHVPTWTHTGG